MGSGTPRGEKDGLEGSLGYEVKNPGSDFVGYY